MTRMHEFPFIKWVSIFLLFLMHLGNSQAQDATTPGVLTGTVISEAGDMLEGVTVKLSASSKQGNSVVTDSKGKFSFQGLKPDHQYALSFSHIGYEEKELRGIKLTDGTANSILVRLAASSSELVSVVVTALNIKKDIRKSGYLIETLKGEELSENKTVNIQNALSGKIPGVDVSNTSNGVAGSKRVVIRGISSISGNNQPLWIIDGIPINTSTIGNATPSGGGGIDYGDGLTYVNPDDIEGVTVLKGNAAAALYGSRASNGVILVTTKSGSQLGKNTMQVTYNGSYTVDQVRDFTDWQYEFGQGNNGKPPVTKQDALSSTSSWGARLDGSPVVQFDGVERPYVAQRDNIKNFYTNGFTFTNTLSLAGRTDKTNYRLSSSYLDNKDVVPNSGYKRNGFSFNSQTRLEKLTVNAVMNYTIEKAKNRQRIGGNYSNVNYTLLHLPTNVNVLDLKPGVYADGSEIGLNNQGIPTNPYFVTDHMHQEDHRRRVNGALELKYDFTSWLYAKGRVLEDYFTFSEHEYTPMGVIWSPKGGGMDVKEIQNLEENFEFILGSNNNVAGDFNFSGFVGGNIYNSERKSNYINGTGFVLANVFTVNNLSVKYPSTGYSRQRTNSLFFNAEMAYRDLTLNVSGRKDWFSTLPLDNNSLFYPSVSLSYQINSDWYPSWMSYAKLRGSFAQVSGGASPYSLNLSYVLDRDMYDNISLQRIGNSTVPNSNLVPLLSTEYEAGTDIGMLGNRLMLNLTYYMRKTRQDIVTTNISMASGYNNAILNLGEISNRGVEVSVNYDLIKTGKTRWEVTGIFSYNKSIVDNLGPNINKLQLAQSKTGNAFINVVQGMPYGQISGYKYVQGAKGQMMYDSKGYPLNDGTLHTLGTGNYDKIASVRSNFKYKNFSLGFLVDSKWGANIYSEINALAVGNGKSKETLEGRETGLSVNGVDAQGNPLNVNIDAANIGSYYGRVASITNNFVYDASFIKLREISLGFNIPARITSKIQAKHAGISLVGRNLFILHKNTPNMDPESNTTSDNAQGIAATVYPSVRSVGVNLNITF